MATVTPNALPVDIDRTANARPKQEPVRSNDAPSFELHLDQETETPPTASAEQPGSPRPVAHLESDQTTDVATSAPKPATPAPSVFTEGEVPAVTVPAIETAPAPNAEPALNADVSVLPEPSPPASKPEVAAIPSPKAVDPELQPAPQAPASAEAVEGLKPDAVAELPAPTASEAKPGDPAAKTEVEIVAIPTAPAEPGGNPAPAPQQSVAHLPDPAADPQVGPQPPQQNAADGEPAARPAPVPVETAEPAAPTHDADVPQVEQTTQPVDTTAVLHSETETAVETQPVGVPVDVASQVVVDEGTTSAPVPLPDSTTPQAATADTPAAPQTQPAQVTPASAPDVQPLPASAQPAQPPAAPVTPVAPIAAVPEASAEPATPAIISAPEAEAPETPIQPVQPASTATPQGEQPATAPAPKPETIAEANPDRQARPVPEPVVRTPRPETPAPQPVVNRPAGGLLAQSTSPDVRTAPIAPQTSADPAPNTAANTLSTFDQAAKAASNGSPERTFAPPSTTIAPNAPVADPAAPLPPTTIAPSGDPVTSTLPLAQNSHDVSIRIAMPTQPGANVQTPVNTLAFNIAKNFDNGVTKFQVRIDPPELGRVDVKMDMTVEGRVQAHLTVERAETLELMMRDARSLEKALADTGLNLGRDSLTFSLKDGNGFSAQDQAGDGTWDGQDAQIAQDETEDQQPQEMARGYISDTGVDISV